MFSLVLSETLVFMYDIYVNGFDFFLDQPVLFAPTINIFLSPGTTNLCRIYVASDFFGGGSR
jgi:hypothetical protein